MNYNKLIFFILFAAFHSPVLSQNEFAIIPKPVRIEADTGFFKFPSHLIVVYESQQTLELAEYLQDQLSRIVDFNLDIVSKPSAADTIIKFKLLEESDEQLGTEGYILTIRSTYIEIRSNHVAGLFYVSITSEKSISQRKKSQRNVGLL